MNSSIVLSSLLLIFGFCFLFGTLILRQLFSLEISIGIYVGSILMVTGLIYSIVNRAVLAVSPNRLSTRLTLFIRLFMPMLLTSIAILIIVLISKTLNETDTETRIFLVLFIFVYAAANFAAIVLLLKLKSVFYKNKILLIKGKYDEQIMIDDISVVKMIFPGIFKIKLKNNRTIFFIPSFLDSLLKIGLTSSKIEELKKDIRE